MKTEEDMYVCICMYVIVQRFGHFKVTVLYKFNISIIINRKTFKSMSVYEHILLYLLVKKCLSNN